MTTRTEMVMEPTSNNGQLGAYVVTRDGTAIGGIRQTRNTFQAETISGRIVGHYTSVGAAARAVEQFASW